jgi:hypothetical protein
MVLHALPQASHSVPEDPLKRLLADNQFVVFSSEQLKNRVVRLGMYLFSPLCRQILFKFSPVKDREHKLADIKEKLDGARIIAEINLEKAQEFEKRLENLSLSLPSHKKITLSYLHNALDNLKKILQEIKEIYPLLNRLKVNLDPTENQEIFHKLKELFTQIVVKIDENHAFLSDFQGRVRIEEYLHQSYEQIVQANLLHGGKGYLRLKNGDIFVSFKTLNFLKQKGVSKWVFRVTKSQVTHVGVFLFGKNMVPMLIHAKHSTLYKLLPLELKSGEVFVVLRPRMNDDQRSNLWSILRRKISEEIKFSVPKLAGVIPSLVFNRVVNLFTKRYVETGNMMSSLKDQKFCSEFLSEAFREAGFPLTPKVKGAMIFPSDIFASPYVDYVGLLFNEDEFTQEKVMEELMQGVKL